jgi:hypothetical protein
MPLTRLPKAETNEANKAKADEAIKAEAHEVNKAIVANEIKACVINEATDATGANEANNAEAVEADEANDAEVAEANEADEAKATDADNADEANLPNKPIDADKADKADSPNKAIDTTEASEVEATETDKADAIVLFFVIANIIIVITRSLLNEGIVIILYSLTKYSAVFAKRKGYFGIMISNNQRGIGRRRLCFLKI